MKSTVLTAVCGVTLLGLTGGCVTPAVSRSFHRTAHGAAQQRGNQFSRGARARGSAAESGRSWEASSRDEKVSIRRSARNDTPNRAARGTTDAKRNDAQFRTAQARWRRDDVTGCRLLLESVLARDPGHRGAVLLSAELALLKGRPQRAIPRVSKLCTRRPDDAQAHHMMAMLLDCAGRRADAIGYYEWAAELDPDDALYQLSLSAATASDDDILVRHGLSPAAAAVAGGSEEADEEIPSDAGPLRAVEHVLFNQFVEDAGEEQEPEYLELDELPAPLRSARMAASLRGLPALRRGSREYSPARQRPAAAAAVASDEESSPVEDE